MGKEVGALGGVETPRVLEHPEPAFGLKDHVDLHHER